MRVRLNLRNLSITEKLSKGRHIVASMTNNTSFPTPNPALAEVTTALDELERTVAAVQNARSEVATRVLIQDNAETKLTPIADPAWWVRGECPK
jgi:hypothetical protein